MRVRDDFSLKVKETLARRAGMHCSNPNCAKLTAGPQENPEKAVNIGVAAHITAAATNGARYDETLTKVQRRSILNGIWLCQSCAKLVDNDAERYSVDLLNKWKFLGEQSARLRVEGAGARGRRGRKYYIILGGDSRLEDVRCPTCSKVIKVDLGLAPGATENPQCNKCGLFHVHREADGTLFTRSAGHKVLASYIACPNCGNALRVRMDKKKLKKPCLDCDSLLHIDFGVITSISPMRAVPADSFCKEDWQQLLVCPNCKVRAPTLGANKNNMLYAQCPKCRYYLTFQKPTP
jgi:ssDNA-binding Zn-finger/Zn-ribbon topoisomerase 1